MKLLLAVCVSVIACASTVSCQVLYTDKYDNVNVDEVLANKRLVVAYIKCALNQGKCTSEGAELKSHIMDALQYGCNKCTATQQAGVRKVLKYLVDNQKDYWKQLQAMYDPQGIYRKMYEKEYQEIA